MLELGHSPYEIAEIEGVTPWSVYRWKKMYENEGGDGLSAKQHPGSSTTLPKEHFTELADLLQQGPQAHGFETDRWTVDRIRVVIEQEFSVSVSTSTVWRYLQRINWSCQKPQRRVHERDVAAVEEWLNETIPAIEKKSAAE